MPVIEPTSPEDCIGFVSKNRTDISNGIYDVKIRAAWIPKLPKDVLNTLLKHCTSTKAVIARSIQAKGSGARVLEQLGADDDATVRVAVASNRHAPTETLVKLAEDYFAEVRIAVAKNPSIPNSLFKELSQDKSSHIRLAVADNPGLDLETANRLSHDRSDNVRQALEDKARDAKTDPGYLKILSKCQNYRVRLAVCENHSIPEEMLEILARDEHAEVRKTVRNQWVRQARRLRISLQELETLAAKPIEEVKAAVATNPNTPPALLERLVSQGSAQLREAVAKNEKSPSGLLQRLAGDESVDVRAGVAQNSHTPMETLEKLRQDTNPRVIQTLAENPVVVHHRKENGLCLNCGDKLGKLRALIGDHCADCT